jgi:hypothetical protein
MSSPEYKKQVNANEYNIDPKRIPDTESMEGHSAPPLMKHIKKVKKRHSRSIGNTSENEEEITTAKPKVQEKKTIYIDFNGASASPNKKKIRVSNA